MFPVRVPMRFPMTARMTVSFRAEQNREVYSFESERDPQGFIWNSDTLVSQRAQARQNRISQFHGHRGTTEDLKLESAVVNEACRFFSFKRNYVVPCECPHFQLRNSVKIVSPEEIYTKAHQNKIMKFNPLNKRLENVCSLMFRGYTFDVFGELLVVGGANGELMLTTVYGDQKFMYQSSLEYTMNNSAKFFNDGGLKIVIGSNDSHLRVIDPETKENLTDITCVAAVNHVSMSKDFNQIAACLDDIDDYIFDRRTGEVSTKLTGHTDFGFCVDWNPNKDVELATGSQDLSVMIWDIRNPLHPVHTLKGALGAAYFLKYSQSGKYLVSSESSDFLNIYDTGNLKERQVLDYFGEISGFGFDESDQDNLRIFLGIADSHFGSVIELHENSQPSFLV